jgi:hypothetical protein
VANGGRADRVDGVVERRVGRGEDARALELRQPARDRVVERDDAVLDERERQRPADRLRHRRDAKQRVLAHRRAVGLDGHPTAGVDRGLAPDADRRP